MLLPSNKIIKSRIKIKFEILKLKIKNRTEAQSMKEKLIYSSIFSIHQSHVFSIQHETLFVYR